MLNWTSRTLSDWPAGRASLEAKVRGLNHGGGGSTWSGCGMVSHTCLWPGSPQCREDSPQGLSRVGRAWAREDRSCVFLHKLPGLFPLDSACCISPWQSCGTAQEYQSTGEQKFHLAICPSSLDAMACGRPKESNPFTLGWSCLDSPKDWKTQEPNMH